jgi:hypothetical protein
MHQKDIEQQNRHGIRGVQKPLGLRLIKHSAYVYVAILNCPVTWRFAAHVFGVDVSAISCKQANDIHATTLGSEVQRSHPITFACIH